MNGPTRNEVNQNNAPAMSHEEALRLNAVELYVLKDLTPEQEAQFEAHYFECRDCAKAVDVEQGLISAIAPQPQPWWRRFSFPVLVPATAALLLVVLYQNLYGIPRLKERLDQLAAPQANTVIVAHPLQLGTEEGEALTTPSVTIELNLPAGAAAPYYRIELLREGKTAISHLLPAPRGSRMSMHMNTDQLEHGSYTVLVYPLTQRTSISGSPIGRYNFTIQ